MKVDIYVIIEYDYLRGGYKSFGVNGLYFLDRKSAKRYMNKLPFRDNCDIEKLNIFEEEK